MHKINQISPLDDPYLQIIECIDDMSDRLYYIGKLPTTRLLSLAIVGSRKPTAYGREVTYQLAHTLARRGVVIISGLALGIDAIAHQAAIDAGGITIAVQANGLHRLYPTANSSLGKSIIEHGGAIISEYETGVEPMQHRFLERNRIVSGLADIVVITEAAAHSGTLNTAAHALAQGKELYVLPGNITSPMSAGCNQLLSQGATPLLGVEQLLDQLSPASHDQAILSMGDTPLETAILSKLHSGERDGDTILNALSANTTEFSTALTMLEINGHIRSLGANQWTLR